MRFRIQSFAAIVVVLTVLACDNDDAPLPDNIKVTIEGVEYPTVTVGSQTWMSINYAGPGGVHFDDQNSRPEFGKYYSKTEVEAIRLPPGWRLPTQQDYEKLATVYGFSVPSNGTHTEHIKNLTSTTQWNNVPGTNASGFNAYPAGYVFQNWPPIPGDIAEFWVTGGLTLSIQEAGTSLTSLRMVFYQSDNSPELKFNVRFVRD
jgi:uncharacterized protein (TIGR02145 family)